MYPTLLRTGSFRNFKRIFVSALAALFLIGALFAPSASAAAQNVGARNATGTDISGFSTIDIHGSHVSGSVFGEYALTVLHYFATWNADCVRELDYMQEAYESFGSSGLLVMGLLYEDSVSTPAACEELFADSGYTYTCLRLDNVLSELTAQYPMVPQTFFVDPSGVVVDHFPGCFTDYNQLERIIRQTLSQPNVYHTVRFVDGLNGRLISRQSVIHGGDAIPPEPNVHPGYVFKGWDGVYTNVTEDRSITAIYVIDQSYYRPGDVNMDGSITIVDAVLTLRYAMGLMVHEGVRMFGDVNGDGRVTVTDAIMILRCAMGVVEL